jgi:hypothetical protein
MSFWLGINSLPNFSMKITIATEIFFFLYINITIVMVVHNKDPCRRAFAMGLIPPTLEIKICIFMCHGFEQI